MVRAAGKLLKVYTVPYVQQLTPCGCNYDDVDDYDIKDSTQHPHLIAAVFLPARTPTTA